MLDFLGRPCGAGKGEPLNYSVMFVICIAFTGRTVTLAWRRFRARGKQFQTDEKN
jgi:hypothetical protein